MILHAAKPCNTCHVRFTYMGNYYMIQFNVHIFYIKHAPYIFVGSLIPTSLVLWHIFSHNGKFHEMPIKNHKKSYKIINFYKCIFLSIVNSWLQTRKKSVWDSFTRSITISTFGAQHENNGMWSKKISSSSSTSDRFDHLIFAFKRNHNVSYNIFFLSPEHWFD